MKHEVDLKNYSIRTDLAIETLEKENMKLETKKEVFDDIIVTDIYIDENSSKVINKKIGNYITIEFNDVTDYRNLVKLEKVFSNSFKKLLNKINIKDSDKCLIIGLGNDRSTPDSLGPRSVNKIIVTSHLFLLGDVEDGFRNVSAFNPGVMGQTGIETSDLILSAIKTVKPNFLIVVDALASSSIERVNRTIQMTDTGIHPGSGIGNSRKEISQSITGIPVIAIGIPTVVDAVTIVSDTINYMHKNFSYAKQNINNPFNKLIGKGRINYLKKDIKILKKDKKKFLGIVGELEDYEIRELISEVLTPIGYNLMVTPKEVDFVIDKLSDVIGNGLNKSLHKKVDK